MYVCVYIHKLKCKYKNDRQFKYNKKNAITSCSIAVRGHDDQGNSLKGKHLTGNLPAVKLVPIVMTESK